MGYVIVAFTASLIIQFAVCKSNKKVIVKLIPLFLEIILFLYLIILSFTPLQERFDTDTQTIILIFALVVLTGIAGIGLAWFTYAVRYLVEHRKNKANK